MTAGYIWGWDKDAGVWRKVLVNAEGKLIVSGIIPVLKTADETVNNSTVLQNDDHLLLPVGANEVWSIWVYVRFISTAVANFSAKWVVPAAGAAVLTTVTGGTQVETDATVQYNLAGAGALRVSFYHLLYIGGANAGNVQFQWAQQVAEASDTIVYKNSFLLAHKLS